MSAPYFDPSYSNTRGMQWETDQALQAPTQQASTTLVPQQHQHQHDIFGFDPPQQTIQIQPRAPNNFRFDTITAEEYYQQQQEMIAGDGEVSRSARSDRRSTSGRRGTSSVSPGVSSSGAGQSTMPSRHPRTHPASPHPYRRPTSATAAATRPSPRTGTLPPVPEGNSPEVPLTSEPLSSRLFSATTPGSMSSWALACPSMILWADRLFSQLDFGSGESSSTPVGVTTSGQMPPPQVQSGRMARAQGAPRSPRYGLCANLLFDVEQDMLEATFEVPGVKRDDIRVKLHECPFSRVKQLTVFGLSRPMPAGRGHSIRQRKAGEFMSSITVFPDTKPENIQTDLQDGVLTVRLPVTQPVQPAALAVTE